MIRISLAALILSLTATAATAQLSGADRDVFVASSIKGCAETVEQDKVPFPKAKTDAFCSCMAQKQAEMTTQADLDYYAAHHALSEDYGKRVKALGPGCRSAAGLGN